METISRSQLNELGVCGMNNVGEARQVLGKCWIQAVSPGTKRVK